ncbi:MAG: extracellular solute-binding protein [Streptosporangiaceae bacterium]
MRRRSCALVAIGMTAMAVLAAGCGDANPARSAGGGPAPSGSGTVRVLYAGSLVNTMEHDLGPAFAKATGYRYQGYGAGSTKIANEIKGKVRRGDVFISANPEVNDTLMGSGGFVSWYVTLARSPLVLAYNPKSTFADQLKNKPWYQVVAEPGFKLGRTDPKLDPKGELTGQAVKQLAKDKHRPGLEQKILAGSKVFPEEDLVGRLQAGQLDAGFFYSIETSELNLPTVSLAPVHLSASYTATVLGRAPNRRGGVAFVAFLLGDKGSKILRSHGFDLIRPAKVSGDASSVPKKLRAVVGAG